jgi:hypothetical protein
LIRERHTHHLKIRSIQDHSCCIFLFHFSSTISPEPKHFVLLIPMNDPNLEQNVLSFFLLILRAPLIRHFDSFSETLVSFFLSTHPQSPNFLLIFISAQAQSQILYKKFARAFQRTQGDIMTPIASPFSKYSSLPVDSRHFLHANHKLLFPFFFF